MAGLRWIAVMLSLLLFARNSSAAVDPADLATLVQEILNRYTPSYMVGGNVRKPMFSLIVRIPFNTKTKKHDISQVTDVGVRETIVECEVFSGSRVIAATLLKWPDVLDQCPGGPVPWKDVLKECKKPTMTWTDVKKCQPKSLSHDRADHAEFRTLQKLPTFLTNNFNQNDFVLIYVRDSPCPQKCTSPSGHGSILKDIANIMYWNEYAVVFSNVFQPINGDQISAEAHKASLLRIAGVKLVKAGETKTLGLSNIFRCPGGGTPCTSCLSNNQVSPFCVSDGK